MNRKMCLNVLQHLCASEQAIVLLNYGKMLTISVRSVQEDMSLTDRLSFHNQINEIHHRLYPHIQGLLFDTNKIFPADCMAIIIAAENSPLIRDISLRAFENALPIELLKRFT